MELRLPADEGRLIAGAVVVHADRLLVRRASPAGSLVWTFPSGKVEPGEAAAEAAAREAMEEAGVVVEPVPAHKVPGLRAVGHPSPQRHRHIRTIHHAQDATASPHGRPRGSNAHLGLANQLDLTRQRHEMSSTALPPRGHGWGPGCRPR
ncbi:NUDIX domain-containing protein [Streptomyces mirabilis]